MNAMAVFEQSSKKSAEFGQKAAEASFSDDSLGISSEEKNWKK